MQVHFSRRRCSLTGAFLVSLPVVSSAQVAERLDVSSAGQPTASVSSISNPRAVSPDGRYVVFDSRAVDLVVPSIEPGDVNIYLRDRVGGTTTLVTLAPNGDPSNGDVAEACVSGDGRFVAYTASAFNMVTHDVNGADDVYVWDRTTGLQYPVSTDASGAFGHDDSFDPDLSADGRCVVFSSYVGTWVAGDAGFPHSDVFLKDVTSGALEHISVSASGGAANGGASGGPSISAEGQWVAFHSSATNLVANTVTSGLQVFVRDRSAAATSCVSVSLSGAPGNGASRNATISADGRSVVFESTSSDLVGGDTNAASDIFVRDLSANQTRRVSLAWTGLQASGPSFAPLASPDGRYVAFRSFAPDIVAGDLNGAPDHFVVDTELNFARIARVNPSSGGADVAATPLSLSNRAFDVIVKPTNSSIGLYATERDGSVVRYCTATLSNCLVAIDHTGAASLSGPDDFHLLGNFVGGQSLGIVAWSMAPAAAPFHGGLRCVQSPFRRSPVLQSGAGSPVSCNSQFDFAVSNAYLTSYSIGAGDTLYAQFIYRALGGIGLSDALAFEVMP
ncbi:MAG: PD40 domain-containing protein [Planctomycetes bacterium]|nr:PD40 domain-containing protein [Planctomycetota bacterium]